MFSNSNDLFGGQAEGKEFRIPKKYWEFFASFISKKKLSEEDVRKVEDRLLDISIPEKWENIVLPTLDVYEVALTK